jgi:hypothetical protein
MRCRLGKLADIRTIGYSRGTGCHRETRGNPANSCCAKPAIANSASFDDSHSANSGDCARSAAGHSGRSRPNTYSPCHGYRTRS